MISAERKCFVKAVWNHFVSARDGKVENIFSIKKKFPGPEILWKGRVSA